MVKIFDTVFFFKKIIFLTSLFFLPFILFLNKNNLPQLEFEEVRIIFFSQLFFLSFIIIFSLLIYKLLRIKYYKNINFKSFLTIIFILHYFSFFYNEKFTSNLQNIIFEGFYFSAFIFLIILIFFFLILLNIFNISLKVKNFLSFFVTIFLIFNYFIFVYDFVNYFKIINYSKNDDKSNLIKDQNFISNKIESMDIYFVILDGMMSLNNAEALGILTEKKILQDLKNIGGIISSDSITNYNTTHLSLTSIFELDYFIKDGKNQYYDMNKVFPKILNNNNTPLLKILKDINRDFYWVGNEWAYCKEKENINCLFQNNTKIYISLNKFYKNNPLIHFINYTKDYLLNKKNYYLDSLDLFFDTSESLDAINLNLSNNDKFFFIHLYKPHGPYIFDSDCNILKNENKDKLQGYSNNYNCVLSGIPNFVNKINEKTDKKNIFFFIGDHGWFNYQKEVFNLIISGSCNLDKTLPKSNINVVRFALNCSDNLRLKFLEDRYYNSKYTYEDNGIFGNFIQN